MLVSSNPKLKEFPNPNWTIQTYKKSTKKNTPFVEFRGQGTAGPHDERERGAHGERTEQKERGRGPLFLSSKWEAGQRVIQRLL